MMSSREIKLSSFYLLLILVILCSYSLIVFLNVVTDPFGIFGSQAIPSFNKFKPEKIDHPRLFKAADVTRIKPKTIFLGTSTTDYGLDPNHPALGKHQPVYNLGLPESNMYEIRRYFEHALYNQPGLKQVIIGIDTLSFDKKRLNTPDFSERRLKTNRLTPKDTWSGAVSIDSFISSVNTIILNLSHLKFQPYDINGERNENWYRESKPAFYLFLKDSVRHIHENVDLSDEQFNNFHRIIEICKEHNIDLKVFIPPTHAIITEGIYRNQKNLSTDQAEKRKLVQMIPVWDFSGFNSITSEKVREHMTNYIDGFHYRKKVGNLVINRMLHFHQETVPADFGFLMTISNIDSHFADLQIQRKKWQKNNPESLKLVQYLEHAEN